MWPLDFFEDIYYWVLPGEYKKKLAWEAEKQREEVRKEKAELLLEYEENLAKAEKLVKALRWDSEHLSDFSRTIRDVIDPKAMERRFSGTSARSIIESFNVERLSKYDEIKQRAIECENTLIRISRLSQRNFGFDITKT
jgi:DNA polymerase III delta prime subunit